MSAWLQNSGVGKSKVTYRLRDALPSAARLAGTKQAATLAASELRHTFGRFVEGFDTADLRVARELLQELPSADLGRNP
jgi:hypothetical protein